MPVVSVEVSSKLESWESLKDRLPWRSILLGNGFSQNVWSRFGYDSLYKIACDTSEALCLSDEDQRLFGELNSTNFERVLGGIRTAERFNSILAIEGEKLRVCYNSIREALIRSIQHVHVPWCSIEPTTLEVIRSELLRYQYVFSTNYDLLLYWALMGADSRKWVDFFWNEDCVFSSGNAEVWDDSITRVLYLHGALHIFRSYPSNETSKITRQEDGSHLLSVISDCIRKGECPLFVSEGSSDDKMKMIHESDYLSFVFREFSKTRNHLVVFGHSLSDCDRHLVECLQKQSGRSIAVGILPNSDGDLVILRKMELKRKLPDAELVFFDATTHALGSSLLRLSANGNGGIRHLMT